MNVRASTLFLLLLVACDGKFGDRKDRTAADDAAVWDLCEEVSCPADGDGAELSCRRWLADPECGDEASNFFLCVRARRVCRDDGTLDSSATFNACATEMTPFQTCAGG